METDNSKVLIIAGMGRSGTSVITQWINKCGLPVGDELLGAAIGNIEGHFEDMDFLKLHEEILVANKLSSTGLIAAETLKISAYQKNQLKNLVTAKNKLYPQWGWKEPRTCLFLNVYKELIPQAKYLIIIRDYKAVTASLLRRDFAYIEKDNRVKESDFFSSIFNYFKRKNIKRTYYRLHAEKYLKVCIAYYQEIIDALSNLSADNFLVVSPEYLKSADKKVYQYLTTLWKFNLKYIDFNSIFKKELLHKKNEVAQFIKDKTLLKKAQYLEDKIKQFIK